MQTKERLNRELVEVFRLIARHQEDVRDARCRPALAQGLRSRRGLRPGRGVEAIRQCPGRGVPLHHREDERDRRRHSRLQPTPGVFQEAVVIVQPVCLGPGHPHRNVVQFRGKEKQ